MNEPNVKIEIVQDEMVVASVTGPYKQVIEEATRYMWQYAQDGPIVVRIVTGKKSK